MNRRIIAVAGVALLPLLDGCSSSDETKSIDVTGVLTTIDSNVSLDGRRCSAGRLDGVRSLGAGDEVLIASGNGELLGRTHLTVGKIAGEAEATCTFRFAMADIPGEEQFYDIAVDGIRVGTYQAGELAHLQLDA